MKKILFFIPIFLFAGLNNSYAYQKGYSEGKILKQMMFGRNFTPKQREEKCLKIWQKDSSDKYIQQHKTTFLQGCEEALSSSF